MGGFINVAADLDSISVIDSENEVAAEEVGLEKDDVESIWQALLRYYRSGTQPALSLCIRRHGKIFFHRSVGHASGNGPGEQGERVLMRPETPVCIFSTSKAISAMLIHSLHDDNHLNLDARVADYLPEFAQNGKQDVTINDILSHKAGIRSFKHPVRDHRLFETDYLVKMLCEQPLQRDFIGAPAYHAATGGFILGEVARRVTGKTLQDLFVERVKKPMGLRYLQYGAAAEDVPQIAHNYVTGPPIIFPFSLAVDYALGGSFENIVLAAQDERFYQGVIPSANMVSNAEEIGRFFEMLLQGGTFEGKRIFAAETVARARHETGNTFFDRGIMMPMRYSAGFMLGNRPVGMFGPDCYQAFGHLGFMNTLCWADPERHISVALLTTGKALISAHLIDYINLISTIADRCRTD